MALSRLATNDPRQRCLFALEIIHFSCILVSINRYVSQKQFGFKVLASPVLTRPPPPTPNLPRKNVTQFQRCGISTRKFLSYPKTLGLF